MTISSPPRPPAQGDPEALIPEARERQRRRRLRGAALAAMAAALVLVLAALASGGGLLGTIRDSLGWGAPPMCRSTQLRSGGVNESVPGVVNGMGITGITNASHAACSIPDPQVSLFSRVGLPLRIKRLTVSQSEVPEVFRFGPIRPVTHVLRPGQSATINWEWENWCPRTPSWVWSEPPIIRFRFGEALTASGQTTQPRCVDRGSASTVLVEEPHLVLPPAKP